MKAPEMTAVYNYDYADRLTVALHDTPQPSSHILFLALLSVPPQLMYEHAIHDVPEACSLLHPNPSLSIFHQSSSPFPMHLHRYVDCVYTRAPHCLIPSRTL